MESTQEDYNMMMDVAKEVSAAGRRKTITLVEAQDTMKKKLARAKDERKKRASSIGPHHRHICEMVATYLEVSTEEVVEVVIYSSATLDAMKSFLDKGNGMGIVFYLNKEASKVNVIQIRLESSSPYEFIQKKIQMTGIDAVTMTEQAVAVYKNTDVLVSIKNIGEVVNYVHLDGSNYSGNTVAMHYMLMKKLLTPPLSEKEIKEWGELTRCISGKMKQDTFERQYNQFVNFVGKTIADIESVIYFDDEEEIQSILRENTEDCNRLNRELIQRVECAVRIWNKKIERALVQYQQLRREDEFVGPLEEVEYWRNQLARFSSIVTFMSSDSCNTLTNFLKLTSSAILKDWKKHCNLVSDVRNECTDNVRYLYSFESFCEPLYRCDPLEIPSHIPSLLYAVRMIFTTSRYFNKMSNVTAILTKVSNQLIIVCRTYLNCDGKKTVWNQPKQVVLTKIRHCLDLYLKYYQCFTHIQEEMKEAGEKPFGCSEMYVFGKLEAFKKRIEEITDVLTTSSTYSILESSKIEGIDEYAIKFKEFFIAISSQKYDTLNHRLLDFDKDYAEYKQKVADTEWLLEEFVGVCLSKMQDVDNVLRLLKRFEKLNLSCLHLDERYLEAMIMFQDELGALRDIYNEERQTPLLPKNMPPVAGRIMWIRHFYKRIEEPMMVFKEKSRVIKHRKVQKCIQLFNALIMVFVHYEKLYHEAWYDYSGQVRSCLNVPILVRHPTTRRYVVNFHPYIPEVIRESKYMYVLKLPVPDVGQVLIFCMDKMLHSFVVTKQLVERNDKFRSCIPYLFIPLMRTLMMKLESAFNPAFSTLTWTSLRIPEFCEQVNMILEYVEIFLKEVKYLMEARINEVLNHVANTSLVYLPDEAILPASFLEANIMHRRDIVIDIENKSVSIENAVVELINKFLTQIDQPDLQENKYNWLDAEGALKAIPSSSKFTDEPNAGFKEIDKQLKLTLEGIHNDCIDLFGYFNMKMCETFVKCTKCSLEQLKKEATSVMNVEQRPIIKTYLELRIPNIVLDPSLEEIEAVFTAVVMNLLETTLYFSMWGQKREFMHDSNTLKGSKLELEPPKKNYHKIVTENKEIVRVFMSLQGIMFLLQPDIRKIISEYLKFSYVWSEDREQKIEEFCDSNPLTVEIVERFQQYVEEAERLKKLPEYEEVGPIRISLENFKLAVLIEANAWKSILGNKLVERNKKKLNDIVDFIKVQEKIMNKPIRDLDECRTALLCLELIRDRFIEMDMDLNLVEETYAVFLKFKIDTPQEDIDRIDSLRFNFENMNNHVRTVEGYRQANYQPKEIAFASTLENIQMFIECIER